jgi:cell division protein FtsB
MHCLEGTSEVPSRRRTFLQTEAILTRSTSEVHCWEVGESYHAVCGVERHSKLFQGRKFELKRISADGE